MLVNSSSLINETDWLLKTTHSMALVINLSEAPKLSFLRSKITVIAKLLYSTSSSCESWKRVQPLESTEGFRLLEMVFEMFLVQQFHFFGLGLRALFKEEQDKAPQHK
jgi:hypothetical protein